MLRVRIWVGLALSDRRLDAGGSGTAALSPDWENGRGKGKEGHGQLARARPHRGEQAGGRGGYQGDGGDKWRGGRLLAPTDSLLQATGGVEGRGEMGASSP